MKKVRITVLKTEFYPDLADRYLTDGRSVGPCALHQVGDTFLYEGGAERPEGLCPWAWIDLYRAITLKAAEAKNDWYKPGVSVECCTDGIRPVIFELAALDEDTTK